MVRSPSSFFNQDDGYTSTHGLAEQVKDDTTEDFSMFSHLSRLKKICIFWILDKLSFDCPRPAFRYVDWYGGGEISMT